MALQSVALTRKRKKKCFVVLICMQAMTHSADNVPNCARAVELVVAGPCFVVQCWFGSFLADQLQ